jgi:hypothetical protein
MISLSFAIKVQPPPKFRGGFFVLRKQRNIHGLLRSADGF